MMEGKQYGGGYSVQSRHIISKWRILSADGHTISMEEAHTSSVWWRVHRMDLLHHIEKDVQYRTTNTAKGVVSSCIYMGKK